MRCRSARRSSAATWMALCCPTFAALFCLISAYALVASPAVHHPENGTTTDSNIAFHQMHGCPNCLSIAANRPLAEKLKVEAIKKQILSKLNLPERPNITSPIPRELVLEALRKAQLDAYGSTNYHPVISSHSFSSSHSSQADLTQSSRHYHSTHEPDNFNYISNSPDDYYGKTSEIIAFAEPGKKKLYYHLETFLSFIRNKFFTQKFRNFYQIRFECLLIIPNV